MFYGTTRGLSSKGNQVWTENRRGIPGMTESRDKFGGTLAFVAGRSLVVGVPFEDSGGTRDAGSALIVHSLLDGEKLDGHRLSGGEGSFGAKFGYSAETSRECPFTNEKR